VSWLPDWDSIESVTTTAHTLHITAIVVLFFLFVAEGLALVYDNRRETLTNIAEGVAAKQRASKDRETQATLDAAKKTADMAQKKADELKRLAEPRYLSDAQKSAIYAVLLNKPKGILVIQESMAAPDAKTYGDEIGAVLKDRLGWNVRFTNALFSGSNTTNVWITIRSGEAIPEGTEALFNALKQAGIEIHNTVYTDPNGPQIGEIALSIGIKN